MQQLKQEVTVSRSDLHPTLTVIVPVASGESQWPRLLSDLADQLPAGCEVLLASPVGVPVHFADTHRVSRFTTTWLTTRAGRASQMNDAARAADGTFLWFLHADSRLPAGSVTCLVEAFCRLPHDLHYFGLRFHDGPRWLWLNERGVSLRCRLFGLPFGDQGLCIARESFERFGGFDESAPYGEDHLFVWKARREGVRLHHVGGLLSTSGRKYAEQGWLRTSCRHVRLTLQQAIPEFARSLTRRGPT